MITLQENNCIAIVDLAALTVTASYTAGTLSLDKIDTVEEDVIDQTSSLDDVKREPDAVAWIDDDHFVTADEGDLDGGSPTAQDALIVGSIPANVSHFIARGGDSLSARDAEGWTAAMVAAFRNPANVRLQAVLIDRAASS